MKSFKERKTKNICNLFNNVTIGKNGEIIYLKEKSIIYQITPLSVIEKDINMREKIFNAYYSCIKGMPSNFQILIMQEKLDFSEQIEKCKKRLVNIQSESLKNALLNYIDKLNRIKDESQRNYKYYIVIPAFEIEETSFVNMFKTLFEMGLNVRRISDTYELSNILKNSMKKELVC